MWRYLLLLILVSTHVAWASDCTMKPAPIDAKRISHHASVKTYVENRREHKLTALLKNGQVLRLVHMGCEHSGASASTWLSDQDLSTSDQRKKQAIFLSRLAFNNEIATDIVTNIQSQALNDKTSGGRSVISSSTSDFMSYTLVIEKVESGWMMTITYVIG
jgi:hypothetical protein